MNAEYRNKPYFLHQTFSMVGVFFCFVFSFSNIFSINVFVVVPCVPWARYIKMLFLKEMCQVCGSRNVFYDNRNTMDKKHMASFSS